MASSKKGKTICVYSSKGGVGKTTTVLNMAGIYETIAKKTLIIDYDLANGGIALALDSGIEKTMYNLCDDLLNNRYRDLEDYVTKYDDYIYYIAAPKDPRQATKIDANFVNLIIERASYLYDVVLIDTTHTLNSLNLTILDKVDNIVFMLVNDLYNLKNMKSMISIFNNLGIDKYKVVLNNSINKDKKYFSLFDIKTILNCNLDYIIPDVFYNKNFDTVVMDKEIYSLIKKLPSGASKGLEILSMLCMDIIGHKNDAKNDTPILVEEPKKEEIPVEPVIYTPTENVIEEIPTSVEPNVVEETVVENNIENIPQEVNDPIKITDSEPVINNEDEKEELDELPKLASTPMFQVVESGDKNE